jgi:TM2 domain-containing membrane protein YozV
MVTDPLYTHGMTEHQQRWFYAEYERARKEEIVAVLLAIFLGDFGAHHFYLRRNGLGTLYLCFFWTGIPALIGFIDALFTPGRVRRYNAMQAMYISSQIRGSAAYSGDPGHQARCPACNAPMDAAAVFCPVCGASTAGTSQLGIQPAV